MAITARPSPNFDARRAPVSLLILHYTNMASAAAAVARMCDPDSKVSAHYLIGEDGSITQMVDEGARAWHAGLAHWAGIDDVNSASIGIELDHPGHDAAGQMVAFKEPQMQALISLAQDVMARHQIAPHAVLGHSDVAPARKIDPGEAFDWPRLATHGIGLWLDEVKIEPVESLTLGAQGPAIAALQKTLSAFGYGVSQDGIFGPQLQAVVRGFQRHFRPRKVDGEADAETQSLIYALCRIARTDAAKHI